MAVAHWSGLLRWGILLAIALATRVAGAAEPARTGVERPNVVYMLADDLGWADVGFNPAGIEGLRRARTPNLDRLAAAGARLERFYVQPVCSPTRAALLTGRYPMRYGLQVGVVRPWAQYGLPLNERLLPQALKEAGYETAICGKWHLGHFQREYLPTRRGFEHQYGHYNGALDYFTHVRDGGFDWHRDDQVCRDEGYSTDLIADEACRLIRGHDRKRPLFLYVAFNAVHAPHQVPAKYKAPYADLPEPRRTYVAMTAAMDEAVGRIATALDEAGMRKQTLIVFSSDNGGPNPGRVSSNGLLRAGKGTVYEGGVRACAFATWDGHIKPGTVVKEPIHAVDWFPTLLALAGAPAATGKEQGLPLDGRDAWPTIARAAPSPHDQILLNATPAGGALIAGNWKLVVNGNAVAAEAAAAEEGDGPAPDAPARGPRAGRRGARGRAGAAGRVELFNLADDPYEKTNLAERQPDRVNELRAHYNALATQAIPPKAAPKPAGFVSPRVWGERD